MISVRFLGLGILFGFSCLTGQAATALVRRSPIIYGTVEGSIHHLAGDTIVLSSGASIAGDLLVPGSPTLAVDSLAAYAGTLNGTGGELPSGYSITLSAGSSLRNIIRRVNPVSLNPVASPSAPAGNRFVLINNPWQTIGDPTTLHSLMLNNGAGQVALPPGTYGELIANGNTGLVLGVAGSTTPAVYQLQRLTLNQGSQLTVVGPVVITVAKGTTISGNMGSSLHPDWLALKVFSSPTTVAIGASVYGYIYSPTDGVIIKGGGQLVGGLECYSLQVDVNGMLRVMLSAANQAPAVFLVNPPLEDSVTLPFACNLQATASDVDGAVTKMEFFANGLKLGETVTAPYTFVWTPAGPGNYSLTAKATDNSGLGTTSAEVPVRVFPSLPIVVDFEASEGFELGNLNGQRGWVVTQGEASVVASPAAASGQNHIVISASQPVAELEHELGNGATHPMVAFADFQSLPVSGISIPDGTIFDIDAARISFLREGAVGRYYLLNGDGVGGGAWQGVGPAIPLNGESSPANWQRITVRLDYAAKIWDFYLGGVLVAVDIPFRLNTAGYFSWFGLRGHATGITRLDSVYAGPDNPLFADINNDGIDDAWEVAHGLSLAVSNRNASPSGNGVSVLQAYLRGTDPNDFYDGQPPTLTISGGDNQMASPGSFNAKPLSVLVRNSAGTIPLANAPVSFTVAQGGGSLALSNAPTAASTASLNLRTGSDGTAQVYYRQPESPDTTGSIRASASAAQVFFESRSTEEEDYYQGMAPTIYSLQEPSGDLSSDGALAVLVEDDAGRPLVNAPIRFTAEPGTHLLAVAPGGPGAGTVLVKTNAQGIARAYVIPSP